MFAFLAYENTQLCGDVLFCVPFFYAAYYMNFFHGVYAECVNYLTDHRLQGCLLHSDHGACPKVTLLQYWLLQLGRDSSAGKAMD